MTAGNQQRAVLLIGSLASFLVGLDALVVTTALPTLHQDFGTSIEGLSWTINAYQLAFAATILTGSALGDRFGRRRMFTAGVALFTVASVLCAVSPSIGLLIAARTLQGIGGGVAVPLSVALITAATPPSLRGRALGIWGAITGLAVAAGPLVGGVIVEGLAWQWVFWLNVPVGIVIVWLASSRIVESTRIARAVDPVGLTLATVGVFGIVQALIRGNDVGWADPTILAGLVGGATVIVLFVAWERRTGHPMMPMSLFRNRGFTGGCLASFVLMAGVFTLGFLTPQYLQLALHHDPLGVGVRLLPATAVTLLLSPIAGRLADRIGERPLITAGLALQATGLILIGGLTTGDSGYGAIMVPLFITGAGIAIAFPTVATAIMRSVDHTQTGVASGISDTFRQVGAVCGVAIATAIFSAQGSYRTPTEFVGGMSPAFLALGGLCGLGALVGVVARRAATPTRQARKQPTELVPA